MNLAFFHIRFDRPELLWLMLAAAPIVWLGMRSLATLDPVRRWTAIALRLLVLVLLVFMLARMEAVQRHTDLTVVALVDQSQSVRRFVSPPPHLPAGRRGQRAEAAAAKEPIEQWVDHWIKQAAGDKRAGDRFGYLTFDGRPTVRQLPQTVVDTDQSTMEQPTPGTDLAAAIRTGMALFAPDSGARLLLVSDGNDTASQQIGGGGGDRSAVIQAADEAAAAGVPIDVLPLRYHLKHEAMVQGVYVSSQAQKGQTVAVRVVLRATQPTVGKLQLLHDGQAVDLNGKAAGTGAPISKDDWTAQGASGQAPRGIASAGRWMAVKSINVVLSEAGANDFQAVFEPANSADTMAGNNSAQAFTLVRGKGRILFVNNVPGRAGYILPRTVAHYGQQVKVISPRDLPTSIDQLQRYDAVVLQNVPANMVSTAQQRMLARYVNDLGGGLVMIGGPNSFGAGGWANSPVDHILPVNCRIPSQTVLPSGALVLVLDRSGSMGMTVAGTNKTKQEIADDAAVLSLHTLFPQDLVGVVAFDTRATAVVPVQMNSDPAAVAKKIRSIKPGGGTNIYSGLNMAYQQLAPLTVQDAAIKHVLLLTDGNSTSSNYIKLVSEMRQAGITLSTVGVGDHVDAQLLQQLASMGGGHFYQIHNPNNLPQVFIKEARTIRKNLIKEKTFQPRLRSTGSPIMQGINAVPKLKGLVLTGRKHDPRIFLPIVTPDGAPVFAHWQVGLGRTAAFTSDADNRWAAPWLKWSGFGDFWSRVMRRIARPAQSRNANIVTSVQGDTLHVRLDAVAGGSGQSFPGDRFANFLTVRGTILKPNGSTEPIVLQQTGPGVYQATAAAPDPGNYIVSLIARQPDGRRHAIFGGVSRPPGAELREFESNLPLLRRIARITGGRVLSETNPERAGLFSRSHEFISRSIRPVWPTLLVWLIVVFLLDVACRRIAWDIAATLAWMKQQAATTAGLLRPREVAAAGTLAALKRRRRQTEAKFQQAGAKASQPAVAAPPSRKRKFEAPADTVVKDDFAEAVGGAKVETEAPGADKEQDGGVDKDEDAATTDRLLDAKRRMRQRYGGDK